MLRYYVSNRLIRGPEKKDRSGWRLPGPELVAKHLCAPEIVANIIEDATTDELVGLSERFSLPEVTSPDTYTLVGRVDISPGKITIALCSSAVSEFLGEEQSASTVTFRYRKRGVETKTILADAISPRDDVLFKNIARAHCYFALVRSGKTYAEIAKVEDVSNDRIQKLIELTFLVPDVIRDVYESGQPLGLTAEWLLRHAFPFICIPTFLLGHYRHFI